MAEVKPELDDLHSRIDDVESQIDQLDSQLAELRKQPAPVSGYVDARAGASALHGAKLDQDAVFYALRVRMAISRPVSEDATVHLAVRQDNSEKGGYTNSLIDEAYAEVGAKWPIGIRAMVWRGYLPVSPLVFNNDLGAVDIVAAEKKIGPYTLAAALTGQGGDAGSLVCLTGIKLGPLALDAHWVPNGTAIDNDPTKNSHKEVMGVDAKFKLLGRTLWANWAQARKNQHGDHISDNNMAWIAGVDILNTGALRLNASYGIVESAFRETGDLNLLNPYRIQYKDVDWERVLDDPAHGKALLVFPNTKVWAVDADLKLAGLPIKIRFVDGKSAAAGGAYDPLHPATTLTGSSLPWILGISGSKEIARGVTVTATYATTQGMSSRGGPDRSQLVRLATRFSF